MGPFDGYAKVAGLILSAALLSPSLVSAETAKRDPGKKLYMIKTCMACHGKNGRKAILGYPNLAGQDKKYMIDQINYILSGKRLGSNDATGNPRSLGMKGALVLPDGKTRRVSKKEIKQIVAWLAKQKPADPTPPKTPPDPASVAAGKKLFKSKCVACHGKEGKKPLKGNPYVAGQKRDYLFIQMRDIRDKARKTPKSAAMAAIVKKMTDAQFAQLADYLSQLNRNLD